MQQNQSFLAPGEKFIQFDRCPNRDCPLTGIENCNHAVKPGCIYYGKSFDLSSLRETRPELSKRPSFNAGRHEGQSLISHSNLKNASLRPPKIPQTTLKSSEIPSDNIPCCNCHSNGRATCAALRSTCACRRAGRQCTSCFPLSKGKCSNHEEHCLLSLSGSIKQDHISHGKSIDSASGPLEPALRSNTGMNFPASTQQTSKTDALSEHLLLADQKMIEAFGVPLLNSDGKPREDLWGKIWERVTRLKGKLYGLPSGAIAKEFIYFYDSEVGSFAEGMKSSEVFVCFPTLILQKDKNVKKTCEIRKLLKRRLQMWKDGLFLELIREAEQCDRNLPKSSGKMNEEREAKIFSDLILQGRLREAVRFITDRQGGGVMDPNDDAGKPAGKTVLQVLIDKHPEQRVPDEEDFMPCQALPALFDIDITNAHVEKAARKLSGSAGVSGFDSFQLQRVLLRFGKHSEKLRESFGKAIA